MLGLLWTALTSQGCANAPPDAGEAVNMDMDMEMGETAVPIAGLSSGANCASGTTLTYAAFGQPFISTYCLKCHSISITGSARQAPPDRNFDDLAAIRMLAPLIDQQAGAGPAGIHAVMPPVGQPAPTPDQRYDLSTWLACGAPK